MAVRPIVPIRATPRPPAVNRPGGLGRAGRPLGQNRPGPAGRGPSGGVQIPPRLPPPPRFGAAAPLPLPRRPILLLLGLLALAGFALWAALNWRPPGSPLPPVQNQFFPVGPGTNVNFSLRYKFQGTNTQRRGCPNGPDFAPVIGAVSAEQSIAANGVGFVIGKLTTSNFVQCSSSGLVAGSQVMTLGVRKADGSTQIVNQQLDGAVQFTGGISQLNSLIISGVRAVYLGAEILADGVTPGTFPPGVRPQVAGDPQPAVAPAVAPVPLPVVPTTRPAPVPAPSRVPAPAAVPGGLPGGALAIPAVPQAVNSIQRLIRRATPGGQPQTITAQGVRTGPTAGPRPTPTGTTFLPGGINLPDQGPRPDLQGIATEVGKLEKKLEILLSPDEPLSLLQQINRAIDQIENIRFVLDALFPEQPYQFGPGQYQLSPVCDRDSEGELLPPRTASWTGGEGEVVEVRRKIDALAQLLQHHKDLKQPTCGGRGSGPHSNVTVHFESD